MFKSIKAVTKAENGGLGNSLPLDWQVRAGGGKQSFSIPKLQLNSATLHGTTRSTYAVGSRLRFPCSTKLNAGAPLHLGPLTRPRLSHHHHQEEEPGEETRAFTCMSMITHHDLISDIWDLCFPFLKELFCLFPNYYYSFFLTGCGEGKMDNSWFAIHSVIIICVQHITYILTYYVQDNCHPSIAPF